MSECENCKHCFGESRVCEYCDNGSKFESRQERPLKELREEIIEAINKFPLGVDPCKICQFRGRRNESEIKNCRSCCYFYGSMFKIL